MKAEERCWEERRGGRGGIVRGKRVGGRLGGRDYYYFHHGADNFGSDEAELVISLFPHWY